MIFEQSTHRPDFHATAVPKGGPDGAAGVLVIVQAQGLQVDCILPLDHARAVHARLGAALRAFDVAQDLQDDISRARNDPDRRVPLGDPSAREMERIYRARLAMRLGLADDDIRAVFDLTINELTLLRAEVSAA